jgi:hypothetical protein
MWLACVLLCFLMQFITAPACAQQSPAPANTSPIDSTKSAAPASQGQAERISIRIEFPLVEPMFDIFYPREEPKLEADSIAPVVNPLLLLSPVPKPPLEEELQAKRLMHPQELLNRSRQ